MKRIAVALMLVGNPAFAQTLQPPPGHSTPPIGAQQPTPSQGMVGQLAQTLAIQSDDAAEMLAAKDKQIADLTAQLAAVTKERDELKPKVPAEKK